MKQGGHWSLLDGAKTLSIYNIPVLYIESFFIKLCKLNKQKERGDHKFELFVYIVVSKIEL